MVPTGVPAKHSFSLGIKRLAPFALLITLHDVVALVRFHDLTGQMRRFFFRREGFPIEDRVGPANMVVNLRVHGLTPEVCRYSDKLSSVTRDSHDIESATTL